MNAEQQRLAENNTPTAPWHRWGPYLAERAWGTVREDYSANGDAWNFFPHDHARSRVYRWNEDGLGGISDRKQRLCFAFAFWNERDPFLKERLFGLTGHEGNHGEDVKEVYWYTDNTPCHTMMRMVYRYPQLPFPYEQLVAENARRSKEESEYEIWDTGIFAENRFFEIEIEYAKVAPEDVLIRITATNCGPDPAPLHILPTLWFRNTWSWGLDVEKPILQEAALSDERIGIIEANHAELGLYRLFCEAPERILFAENESNLTRLWDIPNPNPHVKDSINDCILTDNLALVNPNRTGTKAAAHHRFLIAPNKGATIRLRLVSDRSDIAADKAFDDFDASIVRRSLEADAFYADLAPKSLSEEHCAIQRQAIAGMLWNKQFYHYVVREWLDGDPGQPPPPAERLKGRNAEWRHLYNDRVMSMPDKWEYPWYASWDLAFHSIVLALADPKFAKDQLSLVVREWYQHPNGQIPAYEWNLSDVNPPVIAWAAYRVFQIERKQSGKADLAFLETIFHKMLLTFTWWVNRKDSLGNNIFEGGFLGLDNIGVFDRSAEFHDGTHLEQSDGTSWMGMFSLNLMRIALELARANPAYENIATKFFEHFLAIAAAMNNVGDGIGLWDEEDEFFYDVLHTPGGRYLPLRVRSLVGLMPMLAVETIEPELLDAVPGFKARLEWTLKNRPDLAGLVSRWQVPGAGERRLVALTRGHRMKCLLRRMLDSEEFLSDFGIRSVSRYHKDHPYILHVRGEEKVVKYEPAESHGALFGGNSNWRGPIWFPINYLFIEALQKFHHYYGDDFKVEYPTRSGRFLPLNQIANELSNRLINLWLRQSDGDRPFARSCDGIFKNVRDQNRYWFHEYFNGDTGAGLGASHQTGWTGLVAKLILQQGDLGTIAKSDPFSDL